MQAVRILTRPEKDGELILTDLPVRKDVPVEVIILTQEVIDETALILSALQHDPGYAFLRDPAEDLYTEADVREVP
jgi:hypothetical protein